MKRVQAISIIKLCFLAIFFSVLVFTAYELPAFGTLHNAPSNNVSPNYINQGYKNTGSPNLVTAVLADYRSLDTLFETAVIFTSALACLLILGFRKDSQI